MRVCNKGHSAVVVFENNECPLCAMLAAFGKPQETAECAEHAPNSDYATALRVLDEWMRDTNNGISIDFTVWCKQRLNPPKAADCA